VGDSVRQPEALLILLVIGGIAGFLAGVIVNGYGLGVAGNVIVGIVASVFGGWLMPRLGLFPGGDLVEQIVSATLRALVLLVAIGLIRKAA
jgi:uncharacterized membrane protein YeaQ/YmgE (transglycosylase-associated protein family)